LEEEKTTIPVKEKLLSLSMTIWQGFILRNPSDALSEGN
jgi:hypothetical protein